ncbi:MAG TPA: hypothetical protein VIJ99_09570 [Acidimicrobiales bacterium]
MDNETEVSNGRRRRAIPLVIVVVLVIASGLTAWFSSRPTTTSVVGPEGVLVFNVPNLASASSTVHGTPVDGIGCQSGAKEVVKYHVHAHLSIYVDGRQERLPAGIGITEPRVVQRTTAGPFLDVGIYDCLYWLHTHSYDGIIHIESPSKRAFTLGQFFAIWNQKLGPTRVGPATGTVIVFENGKRFTGDPTDVPLLAHGDIQIDVGSPVVAFQPFTFKVTGGCGEGTNSCSVKKK